MMIIVLIFCAIGYLEWRYLKRNNRSTKTFGIVLAYVFFIMLFLLVLYLFRNSWTVFNLMKAVFYPLQKIIFLED